MLCVCDGCILLLHYKTIFQVHAPQQNIENFRQVMKPWYVADSVRYTIQWADKTYDFNVLISFHTHTAHILVYRTTISKYDVSKVELVAFCMKTSEPSQNVLYTIQLEMILATIRWNLSWFSYVRSVIYVFPLCRIDIWCYVIHVDMRWIPISFQFYTV